MLEKLLDKGLEQFAEKGIIIHSIENDKNRKVIRITVPSSSDLGDENCGEEAAKAVKSAFKGTPLASCKVYYKVRDEHWTADKKDEALANLKEHVKAAFAEKGIKI